jgi:hypothetical protein
MLKKILKISLLSLLGLNSSIAQTWTNQGTAPLNTTIVEVGSNGVVYYLTSANSDNVFSSNRYKVSTATKLPGQGTLVDISSNSSRIFGVNGSNNIYEFGGSVWNIFTNGKLTDVTSDDSGLYGCNNTLSANNVYSLSLISASAAWAQLPGLGTLTKIDRANDQTMVGYNANGSYIYNNSNGTWPSILNTPASISAISTSGINNTWCLAAGVPYKYNQATNSWTAQAGSGFLSISTFGLDEVWVLKNDGNVYCNKTLIDPSASYSSLFTNGPAGSKQLEIATNGDVLILTHSTTNNVFKMNSSDKTFTNLSGNRFVYDIASSDKLFGTGLLSSSNNIYKHNSTNWAVNHVAGELADIDINSNTLFGVNSGGSLYTLDITNTTSTWVGRTLPAGAAKIVKVAITKEGTLIVVDAQNKTYISSGTAWALANNLVTITSITALDNNNIWALANDDIYKFDLNNNIWNKVHTADGLFKSISIGVQNELFVLDITNKIYKINTTVTEIDEQDNQKQGQAVYPNPVIDQLTVNQYTEIFDLNGNKIAEGSSKINMSTFAKGIYFAKTNGQTTKVIKE